MNIKVEKINNEILGIFTFIDPRNRNMEVTAWHDKVHQHLGIPINYIEIDYRYINHGAAMQNVINTFEEMIEYFIFLDNDAIILKQDGLKIIHDKIKDKNTIFGGCQNSNHINVNPKHPFIQPSTFCISKSLYNKLGKPSLSDHSNRHRSDTCEEITWLCQEKGYNVCMVYPSNYSELTEEECKKSGAPRVWPLTETLNYGIGTTYGDLFFHAGMQGLPRSSEIFIKKAQSIINSDDRKIYLEAVLVSVGYGDTLKFTLPKNKKHFDKIIVITDYNDHKTKQICIDNGVECIITDCFYKNGAKFNKGAAINQGYSNLKHYDWCVNLDADIILPDNFRHSFLAHELDKNLLYGAPRKFVWNMSQYSKLENNGNLEEELLTLDGIGCGYFQAFNFKSDKIKNIEISKLYPDSITAEKVDIDFLYRFYPEISPKVPKLFFEVLHLGPPGLFNRGVEDPKLISLKGKIFEDFPNELNDKHEIFKDCQDIYNHQYKKEQSFNKYYKYFKNNINHRDFVFRMCLSKFNNLPINILEIGTSRSLEGKAGDGWSTLFWCDFINKNGGKLTVCDIDPVAIDNARKITSDYLNIINIEYITDDGLKYINDDYDIVFLDGSDCPIQMLDQFEKVNRKKSLILCDDFHVKGHLLRQKYQDYHLIKVNDIHEMAIYYKL